MGGQCTVDYSDYDRPNTMTESRNACLFRKPPGHAQGRVIEARLGRAGGSDRATTHVKIVGQITPPVPPSSHGVEKPYALGRRSHPGHNGYDEVSEPIGGHLIDQCRRGIKNWWAVVESGVRLTPLPNSHLLRDMGRSPGGTLPLVSGQETRDSAYSCRRPRG